MNDERQLVFADRYEVERELGRGGMATVYLALDRRHGRRVALKLLDPALSQSFGVERFQREITITAQLTHPNILPLHDSGEADGRLFYVAPFIAGESLRDRLRRERQLPVRDAITIARGLVSALEHAHAHGVVHRDIKPENILLADGQAIVADFGIARMLAANADERITATGISIGTPAYMSPEQATGESAIDARTDIYSAGCVIYEMLAGEPPFTGATPQAVMAKRFTTIPTDLRTLRENIPEVLGDAIARSLARAPADRFQTASELRLALEAAGAESPHAAAAFGARARSGRYRSRTAIIASGIVAAALMLSFAIPAVRQILLPGRQGIHTLAVLPLSSVADGMGGGAMNGGGGMAKTGDMGGGGDFFADGMTDALITGLSQLGSVNVISRMSVMRYRMMKKPLRDIARELKADAVVEGSVVHSGDRVRISATLVRASDEKPLWTHSYERQVGDALALQTDIADAVAHEIGVRLVGNTAVHVTPVKPAAQEWYLKGSYFAGQWRLQEAIDAFQRAVAIDPNHATAYSALARAYYFRAFFGEIAPAEAFSQMRRAAARALQSDSTSAEAHGLLALVDTHYDWDWKAAEDHFRRALILNPNNAQVHHDYAHFLLAAGRQQESVAESRRALQLDPANPMLTSCVGWHSLFDKRFADAASFAAESQRLMPSFWALVVSGWANLGQGNNDAAVAAMRSADKLSKGLPFTRAALAHALAKSHQTREARALLDTLLQQSLRTYVSAYDIAIVYAGLGENDHAIEWLRKAVGERSMFVVHLSWDARLDGLRADPRFVELAKQIGAPGQPPKQPATLSRSS